MLGNTAPFIRIGLRYVAGYLVFKSVIPAEWAQALADDPELVTLIGVGLASLVEGAYALARRFGWSK